MWTCMCISTSMFNWDFRFQISNQYAYAYWKKMRCIPQQPHGPWTITSKQQCVSVHWPPSRRTNPCSTRFGRRTPICPRRNYTRSCVRRGTSTVASLGLTINIEMNINMHINIERWISTCISILKDALPTGALPPNPHAFGGTGFFRCHVITTKESPTNIKPFHYPLPPPSGSRAGCPSVGPSRDYWTRFLPNIIPFVPLRLFSATVHIRKWFTRLSNLFHDKWSTTIESGKSIT